MATLADLKTRVQTETVRDDLADDLATQLSLAISRAIEFYQGERFWFNYGSASATATSAVLSMPATMRVIDQVRLSDGTLLSKWALDELLTSTDTGTPTRYAEYGDGLYLDPAPTSTAVTVYGTKYITPPSADADSTVWTNEAYDLIAAHTRFILYRDVFRDPDAAQMAQGAIGEALQRLKHETARRNKTPLRAPAMPSGRYSYTGYY